MPFSKLPTLYQQMIHLSRYSRWLPEQKRRETWGETVKRYFDFMEEHLMETCDYHLTKKLRNELENAVLNLEVMPSMRCLMTAGPALKRDNGCAYNCAAIAVDSPRAFDETLYVLMNGSGVGFSVERQFVSKLPIVPEELFESNTVIIVEDSKLGWAKALKELIGLLYLGQIPKWDMYKIRPAGVPLKIFGGRSAGAEPLDRLFKFCVKTFKNSVGRKLQSIECHDIMTTIGDCVVSGGVRRSAMASLSNLSDERMRQAKSGNWWESNPQRALANNSVCYTEKPEIGIFMQEWISLYQSKCGERGIFSRAAAIKQVSKNGRRDPNYEFLSNPCFEIILRNKSVCNLTEAVCRESDDLDTLKRKVKLATILGTFQSTLINFKYLSKEWKRNCEEERLLGVSLTGVMDCKLLNNRHTHKDLLSEMKQLAIDVNKEFAKHLGINQATAITTAKPSGSVSQLVNSSSGIHTRHSKYYIRTIRNDNKDPLTKLMIDVGFPHEVDCMKPDSTIVFSFPIKSPGGSIYRDDVSAIEQLEFWMSIQDNWCEHKPSVTITVKEHEWLEVAAWVYRHFDVVSGISFLPYSDSVYKQMPYTECSEKEYIELLAKMPKDVDWSKLSEYEDKDMTTGSREFACTGNACETI